MRARRQTLSYVELVKRASDDTGTPHGHNSFKSSHYINMQTTYYGKPIEGAL